MGVGNKPLKKKEGIVTPATLHCLCCNKEFNSNDFYDSDSELHESIGKIPYCRECLDKFYKHYYQSYKDKGYPDSDRRAIERICMMLDLYYSDNIFDGAVRLSEKESHKNAPFISFYLRQVKLYQYRGKNYDNTIHDKHKEIKDRESVVDIGAKNENNNEEIDIAIKLFGNGFEKDDYLFLYHEYSDWTVRHECNTKAQEEVFKQICLTQLGLIKAARSGDDTKTKDLAVQYQKWLDTGKLQPKQSSGDTTAETQTFGTLIDKWENTRPLPEIDEELRDVDSIGLYLDVFFRGHLAKMMGLKNGLSNLYDKYIKRYTVTKPEYDEDDSNEAAFDAIFGSSLLDDEEDV